MLKFQVLDPMFYKRPLTILFQDCVSTVLLIVQYSTTYLMLFSKSMFVMSGK